MFIRHTYPVKPDVHDYVQITMYKSYTRSLPTLPGNYLAVLNYRITVNCVIVEKVRLLNQVQSVYLAKF